MKRVSAGGAIQSLDTMTELAKLNCGAPSFRRSEIMNYLPKVMSVDFLIKFFRLKPQASFKQWHSI